jgi:hypothetical protein
MQRNFSNCIQKIKRRKGVESHFKEIMPFVNIWKFFPITIPSEFQTFRIALKSWAHFELIFVQGE